jgi:hypothetical protein
MTAKATPTPTTPMETTTTGTAPAPTPKIGVTNFQHPYVSSLVSAKSGQMFDLKINLKLFGADLHIFQLDLNSSSLYGAFRRVLTVRRAPAVN